MKKITFILFALFSGTAFAQLSAEATAAAEIVEPLTITKVENSELNFGRIISPETAGSVQVLTDGTRNIDEAMDAPGGTISAAEFVITGDEGRQYDVEVVVESNALSDLNGDGVDMPLVINPNFSENYGNQNLILGGTLTVGAGQAAGTYETTITVSVNYE